MASSDNKESVDVESNGAVGVRDTDWRQAKDLDFLYAARLIRDAIDLRNITFKKTFESIRSYEIFLSDKITMVLRVTILVHLLLPIFEEPAVVATPYWVPCIIETICLFIFMLRWVHLRTVETAESFNKDKKNWVLLVVFVLILIDLTAFIVAHELNFSFKHRLTRPLRVLFYINFIEGKELRRAFRNVRKTLPDILNVFALFLVSILIFGFLAFKLFNGKLDADKKPIAYSNGEPYFQNYEDSIWDLYISVTTANFPDVMMPAYDLNGAYSIFFIIFMLVNFYIFINIILATIYTNYKKHLKEEVKTTLEYKRAKMKDAFDLIKENLFEILGKNRSSGETAARKIEFKKSDYILSEHEQIVTCETFKRLISRIDPKKSEKRINVLFEILDVDGNNLLSFREFVHLADLLSIRMSEIKDRQIMVEKLLPALYNSKPSQIVRKIVGLKIFQFSFDLLIFLNIIFVIFLSDKPNYEWVFLSLFLVEILLKLYTCGFRRFVALYWNIFDTVIILGSLIAGIVEAAENSEAIDGQKKKSTELFEIILVLRSLRVLKFVSAIKRFRTIITTIAIITPSLVTYGMLLLTIYYVYSMIGMEIFGKTIQTQPTFSSAVYNCRNLNLNGTDFVKYKYCKNNFSSFPNSLIMLFELMVVNQWHILSKGFEYAMGTKWTRLYFFAFHLTCVIVSLNIFTAFVIEAFLLEYETEDDSKSDYSKVEQRIIHLGLHYIEDAQDDQDSQTDNKGMPLAERVRRSIVRLFVAKNPYYSDSSVSKFNAATSINSNNTGDDENVTGLGNKSAIRFHIYSRDAKPVEILLQRMFSDEFDIEQEDLMSISASAASQ